MDRLYEFCVMPFGNVFGVSFKRCARLSERACISRSVEEHLHHLAQVFERLQKIGLKLHFLMDSATPGIPLVRACTVLEQEQGEGLLHMVAYASHTILKHEAHYRVTDLEALGVALAAKHFHTYLWGHQCEPSCGPSTRLSCWLGELASL